MFAEASRQTRNLQSQAVCMNTNIFPSLSLDVLELVLFDNHIPCSHIILYAKHFPIFAICSLIPA